jgi:hypothetical protein
MSRNRTVSITIAMVFTGAVVAILPATVQALAARVFDTASQAHIAVAISFGAFAAAIVNAAVLESRLTQQSDEPRTFIPRTGTALASAASLALIVFHDEATAVLVSIPLIMICLQLGRTHATIEDLWRSELVVGVALLISCGAAFLVVDSYPEWAFPILGAGALFAVAARQFNGGKRPRQRSPLAPILWVSGETAIVASTPFVLNVAILFFLGPSEAIAFRLILTVLGVLQPVLGYLRTKLLGSPSTLLTIFLSVLSCVALGAVLFATKLGLFEYIFGDSWSHVPFAALAVACAWKLISIPGTIPFAEMRRRGEVSTVFTLRAISTVAYIALGVVVTLIWSSSILVFVAFCAAELITLTLYSVGNRRGLTQLNSLRETGSDLPPHATNFPMVSE